jgi:hypothetical protein
VLLAAAMAAACISSRDVFEKDEGPPDSRLGLELHRRNDDSENLPRFSLLTEPFRSSPSSSIFSGGGDIIRSVSEAKVDLDLDFLDRSKPVNLEYWPIDEFDTCGLTS